MSTVPATPTVWSISNMKCAEYAVKGETSRAHLFVDSEAEAAQKLHEMGVCQFRMCVITKAGMSDGETLFSPAWKHGPNMVIGYSFASIAETLAELRKEDGARGVGEADMQESLHGRRGSELVLIMPGTKVFLPRGDRIWPKGPEDNAFKVPAAPAVETVESRLHVKIERPGEAVEYIPAANEAHAAHMAFSDGLLRFRTCEIMEANMDNGLVLRGRPRNETPADGYHIISAGKAYTKAEVLNAVARRNRQEPLPRLGAFAEAVRRASLTRHDLGSSRSPQVDGIRAAPEGTAFIPNGRGFDFIPPGGGVFRPVNGTRVWPRAEKTRTL